MITIEQAEKVIACKKAVENCRAALEWFDQPCDTSYLKVDLPPRVSDSISAATGLIGSGIADMLQEKLAEELKDRLKKAELALEEAQNPFPGDVRSLEDTYDEVARLVPRG